MRRFLAIALLVSLSWQAVATDSFVISDIRVEGLQRISEGTVFNYLPVEVGDRLTPANSRVIIRELYRTGFFTDVSVEREDGILIIQVVERPSITSVSITGNRQISDEELMPALAQIGIAEGETFDQLQLDRVKQELVRSYFNQGHYGVEVTPTVNELDRNRVSISILVREGDQARIRHLNIVGNETFDEKELRSDFESDTRRGLFFWQGRTQYSQEKLTGDLESLRSFYLDRGYLDFSIESTQVSISPDKEDIYITANIREGEVYTVTDTTLTGDLVLPEDSLRQLIQVEEGETFSRRKVEESTDAISRVLANVGYAFANVNPVPDIDRDNREVSINFFIDPGQRVYVRRIEFQGNTRTQDEVMRREMRQLEGAWFSQSAVDRSRQRLQILGYFQEVNIETPAVEGKDDQIDIIVSVEERPSGEFSVGLGYSQIQGMILSASLSQDNFLGTGRRVALSVNRSRIFRQATFSYNNPFFTDDGVSAGFFLRYSEFDQGRANISAFSTSVAAAGGNIGFPITEVDFLQVGAAFRRTDINIGQTQAIDPDCPITEPGCPVGIAATRPLAITLDENQDGFLQRNERRVNSYIAETSWRRDTRNHYLNPSRGSRQRFGIEAALPGSTRHWYKLNYRGSKYFPLTDSISLGLRADIAHGDAYDNYDDDLGLESVPPDPDSIFGNCRPEDVVSYDDGLPFYEHFFGGGVSDVRGFNDNSLGPKDQNCRAVGGDFKVIGGMEVSFPVPMADLQGVRLAWFVDVGNVYRNYQEFDANELRASTGLSVRWEAPVGPIVINLSHPIRKRDGDRTELFQFQFGTQF